MPEVGTYSDANQVYAVFQNRVESDCIAMVLIINISRMRMLCLLSILRGSMNLFVSILVIVQAISLSARQDVTRRWHNCGLCRCDQYDLGDLML